MSDHLISGKVYGPADRMERVLSWLLLGMARAGVHNPAVEGNRASGHFTVEWDDD